jgi:hypothetical protein
MNIFWIIFLVIILAVLGFRLYRFIIQPPTWKAPEVASTVSIDKPKVIIYTSYDEAYSKKKFVQHQAEILKSYAGKHNHDYRQIIHKGDEMSPYWTRVKDLLDIMANEEDGTIIMYIDADAVPVQPDLDIVDFISSLGEAGKSSDIFISEDPFIEKNPVHQNLYGRHNTGLFIVRNNKKTREFARKWMAMYDNTSWIKDDKGWSCVENGLSCLFAGEKYEQGSFTKLAKDYTDIIMSLNSSTLACDKVSESCFVMHLLNTPDDVRESTFVDMAKVDPTTDIGQRVVFSGLNI